MEVRIPSAPARNTENMASLVPVVSHVCRTLSQRPSLRLYKHYVSFAAIIVWRVRVVVFSRAQCCEKIHPLVFSLFLFFIFVFFTASRMQDPRVSEKQKIKKERPYGCLIFPSGTGSTGSEWVGASNSTHNYPK